MAEITIIDNLCQILEDFDHLKQHPEFDKIANFLQGNPHFSQIVESPTVKALLCKAFDAVPTLSKKRQCVIPY